MLFHAKCRSVNLLHAHTVHSVSTLSFVCCRAPTQIKLSLPEMKSQINGLITERLQELFKSPYIYCDHYNPEKSLQRVMSEIYTQVSTDTPFEQSTFFKVVDFNIRLRV